jgi:hypothetical protein
LSLVLITCPSVRHPRRAGGFMSRAASKAVEWCPSSRPRPRRGGLPVGSAHGYSCCFPSREHGTVKRLRVSLVEPVACSKQSKYTLTGDDSGDRVGMDGAEESVDISLRRPTGAGDGSGGVAGAILQEGQFWKASWQRRKNGTPCPDASLSPYDGRHGWE